MPSPSTPLPPMFFTHDFFSADDLFSALSVPSRHVATGLRTVRVCVLVVAAALLVGACDSGSNDEDDLAATGRMEAVVDGANWEATNATANTVTAAGRRIVTFNGAFVESSTEQEVLSIQVTELSATLQPGTYSLDSDDTGDGISAQGSYQPNSDPTSAFLSQSGSLTIDSIDDESASGTFSFTALNPSSGNTIEVTDGRFNVQFGVSIGS